MKGARTVISPISPGATASPFASMSRTSTPDGGLPTGTASPSCKALRIECEAICTNSELP